MNDIFYPDYEDIEYYFNNFTLGRAFELIVSNPHSEVLGPIPVNGGTIPVRKLFVNNARSFTPEKLEQIFKEYGQVMDIFLPTDAMGYRQNYVFISYLLPSDAQQVIKTKKKALYRRYKLIIYPADQWHQPLELPNGEIQWSRGLDTGQTKADQLAEHQAAQSVEPHVEEASSSESEVGPSIQMLNDDCLAHVFSFLTKRELVAIERVCRRWRDLSLSSWQSVTSLDFRKGFMLKDDVCLRTDHFRELMLRCGNHLTSLDISNKANELTPERTINLISRYCRHLTHLNISNLRINKAVVLKLNSRLSPKLKSLYLERCTGLTDHLLGLLLRKSKQLSDLSVAKTNISGKGLFNRTRQLKRINLNYCRNISSDVLEQFLLASKGFLDVVSCNGMFFNPNVCFGTSVMNFTSLSFSKTSFYFDSVKFTFPQLKALNVSFGSAVNDKMLHVLPEVCPDLEELDISGCCSTSNDSLGETLVTDVGVKHLAKLTKLSYLNLSLLRAITSESLEYLAVNAKGNLQKVECKGCSDLTDSGPSRLVALCPKLHTLDLKHCREVTNNFLKAALDSVKLRTNNVSLHVHVACTGVEEFPEEHPLLIVDRDCSRYDWLGFGVHMDVEEMSDLDVDFMDELDWEAQSMFGDDVDAFRVYQRNWMDDIDYDIEQDEYDLFF